MAPFAPFPRTLAFRVEIAISRIVTTFPVHDTTLLVV